MNIWNVIIVVSCLGTAFLLLRPSARSKDLWRATATPLASIIGSGFLVCAPILGELVGDYAVVAMMMICAVAYAVGSAVRFNISCEDETGNGSRFHIGLLSDLALGLAYMISVTYYIQLLSAFALRGFGTTNELYGNVLSTGFLVFIGSVGFLKGLSPLEFLEEYSVGIKLAVIAGLLVGLVFYNADHLPGHHWNVSTEKVFQWDTWRRLMGLLIIVQGFETSRYLGRAYTQEQRIKSMKIAQLVSWGIYVIFVGLMTVLFGQLNGTTETEIVPLSGQIASVLPSLVLLGAVMSQFSAAIADTIGSGGLLTQLSRSRLSSSVAYLLIAAVCVLLVWLTNVFEIITLASRAFAVYYAIQTLEAFWHCREKGRALSLQAMFYLVLFGFMILIAVLGIPMS